MGDLLWHIIWANQAYRLFTGASLWGLLVLLRSLLLLLAQHHRGRDLSKINIHCLLLLMSEKVMDLTCRPLRYESCHMRIYFSIVDGALWWYNEFGWELGSLEHKSCLVCDCFATGLLLRRRALRWMVVQGLMMGCLHVDATPFWTALQKWFFLVAVEEVGCLSLMHLSMLFARRLLRAQMVFFIGLFCPCKGCLRHEPDLVGVLSRLQFFYYATCEL